MNNTYFTTNLFSLTLTKGWNFIVRSFIARIVPARVAYLGGECGGGCVIAVDLS